MESSSNISWQLAYSLEKIAKVLSERIRARDLFDIDTQIKWLNKTLSKVFDLEDSDYEKFRDIIDPKRKYNPVEPIDWKNIDWNDIKVERQYQTDPSNKFIHEVGESKEYYRKGFFETFISTLFELWKSCIEAKEYKLAFEFQLMYMNLLSHVIHLDAKKFNLTGFVEERLNEVYLLNYDIISFSTEDWESDFAYEIGVSKPLDAVYREGFKEDLSNLFFRLIYRTLALLHSNNPSYVLRYIGQLTDGQYTERWSSFPSGKISRLQILVSKKDFSTRKKDRLKDLLMSIRPENMAGLRDLKSLGSCYESLKEIKEIVSESEELLQVFSESDFYEIKKLIASFYKSYQMRLNVIQVLAIALFRKDYDTIKNAFNYNQPSDSGATWSNRDVVPLTVREICNFISDEMTIENNLFGYWPGHHGTTSYLNRLQIISLSNHIRKSADSSPQNFVTHIKNQYKEDYQVINVFLHRFSTLYELSKHLQDDLINQLNVNNESVQEYLSSIKEDLKTYTDLAPQRIEITKQKVFPFVNRVIKGFFTDSSIYKLFKADEPQTSNRILRINIQLGYMQSVPKTYFIDSWHVLQLDYEQIVSTELANRFDKRCYSKLDQHLKIQEKTHFTKVKDLLVDYVNDDFIWIFSVVSPAFIFHQDGSYVPDADNEENGTYRGVTVMKTRYDWNERCVRIIRKSSILNITLKSSQKDFGYRNGIGHKTLYPTLAADLERIKKSYPYEPSDSKSVFLDFLVDASLSVKSDYLGYKIPVETDI